LTAQHTGGGVAADTGILDLHIVALLPEHGLQLCRVRLIARYAIAGGVAGPERDDAHRRR